MNRKQAIERFNDYLLKTQQPYMYPKDKRAVTTAILSMEKLEKIEQIVDEKGNIWSASVHERLKEILKEE